MSGVKMPKTSMSSRTVTIEGCYFPFPEKTTLKVEDDGFTLSNALVIPMDEAARLGIVRQVTNQSGSHSFELAPEPGSSDTLQHCFGCTCKP